MATIQGMSSCYLCSTFTNYTILTGIASGCHVKAQDVGRGTKDADVAADPGIPLRHDLPLRADRALPRLRNLQRHATHGGLQVVATATSKFDELLIYTQFHPVSVEAGSGKLQSSVPGDGIKRDPDMD